MSESVTRNSGPQLIVGARASGFSHELNTPLATVLTCVEGILSEADSPWAYRCQTVRFGQASLRRAPLGRQPTVS